MPLIRLMMMANPRPNNSAQPNEVPVFASCKAQATEIAMVATMHKSMPRPITTTSMPIPKIPSTATLRKSVSMFCADRKFDKVRVKILKSTMASRKTMRS
ncbi:hypothetical protein SDC9_185804 [bioreactor metagenome]|uniref:Uncharacterized protein n=1 Tax=bioreactor metagenome TaxID=1076179 RepID=A0A645HHR8_9ZZZZ